MHPVHKAARDHAVKKYMTRPEVVSVGIGYRQVGGKYTDEVGVIIGVKKKLALEQLASQDIVEDKILGLNTDVVEHGEIKILTVEAASHQAAIQELNARMRPCPGGFSVGHVNITAGTLGIAVHRGIAAGLYILSNNHVLANSNLGQIGDPILQPGPYDGGHQPADQIATLTDFVRINFDGQGGGGGKKNKKLAMMFWHVSKAIPNAIARITGCPYRLVISATPNSISQPTPNLVDCAVALVSNPGDVLQTEQFFGDVHGIRDLALGDRVKKAGRTTEETHGRVVTIGATVQVSYGPQGTATFADQLVISADTGEFSAGGDSGSAILTETDDYLGGLLFAGSPGVTICNRISNIVSLLGIRL